MMSNNRNDDQQCNGPFDQWLREHRPPQPAFSQDMDAFLEEFQTRMAAEQKARSKRRKRNLKRGSTVMIVALLSIAVFNLPELGGDGFNMVEVENAQTPGGVVENEFRVGGFNVLEGETEQELQATSQEIATGIGDLVSLEGWEIDGVPYWSVERIIFSQGKEERVFYSSKDLTSTLTKTHARFFSEKRKSFLNLIEKGEIPRSGKKRLFTDGVVFSVEFWILDDPRYGHVTYSIGVPIP